MRIKDLKEKILDEIRYGELNNDMGFVPEWLNKTDMPRHAESTKCFRDGVTCKRYTDAIIVKTAFDEFEQADVPDTNVGQWKCLEQEIGLYACSECGYKILRQETNYCPNCGAKMLENIITLEMAVERVKNATEEELKAYNSDLERRLAYTKRIRKSIEYKGNDDHEDVPSILCDFQHEVTNAQWIPCSERLPDVEYISGKDPVKGHYLTCAHDGNMGVLSWCEGWNCYRLPNGSAHKDYEITDIVAWMPLPEPYEESED